MLLLWPCLLRLAAGPCVLCCCRRRGWRRRQRRLGFARSLPCPATADSAGHDAACDDGAGHGRRARITAATQDGGGNRCRRRHPGFDEVAYHGPPQADAARACRCRPRPATDVLDLAIEGGGGEGRSVARDLPALEVAREENGGGGEEHPVTDLWRGMGGTWSSPAGSASPRPGPLAAHPAPGACPASRDPAGPDGPRRPCRGGREGEVGPEGARRRSGKEAGADEGGGGLRRG